MKYSTGETILPKHWNEKEQRARISLKGGSQINGLLDRIEEATNKIFREALTYGKVFIK